ncbi:hypothetical protein HMPREF9072_01506 [Capnocytophaga sp. oral taxon 324 str. F0483]|nr:hypothetical protein HMPREF9072_01506 [Capnocytophaga sp. oral taxon 324 str. F0483]
MTFGIATSYIGNIFYSFTNKAEYITIESPFYRFPPFEKAPFILYQSSKIRSRFV